MYQLQVTCKEPLRVSISSHLRNLAQQSIPLVNEASILLSLVRTPIGFLFGSFLGLVALLLAALIIIRLMPDGISAWLQRYLDRWSRIRISA